MLFDRSGPADLQKALSTVFDFCVFDSTLTGVALLSDVDDFCGGVYLAARDCDGDGRMDIILGAGLD